MATKARRVVTESLDHLFRLIGSKGRFVYSHALDRPDLAGEGYNLLRHCGTLWFMLRAINELDLRLADHQVEKIVAAVGYVGQKLDSPAWIAGDHRAFALVTKGAIKLGGVGLSLVMLSEFRRFLKTTPAEPVGLPAPLEETVIGLEAYALAQVVDGDFLHKRRFDNGVPLDFYSDYYTGEMLLGLFASDRTISVATEICTRLMQSGYGLDVQSHWMAYAACEAVARGRVDVEVGLNYLRRLMHAIITDSAYRERRQSTPIACRSEALTRYLVLMREPGFAAAATPQDLANVRDAASDNLLLQLDWYRHGQFWKGDEDRKVQIDYIQHNGTAFLNWLEVAPART